MACVLVKLQREGKPLSISLERYGKPVAVDFQRIGAMSVAFTLECSVVGDYLRDKNGIPLLTVDGHLLFVKS